MQQVVTAGYDLIWTTQGRADELDPQRKVCVNHFVNSQEVTSNELLIENIKRLEQEYVFDASLLPVVLSLPQEKREFISRLRDSAGEDYYLLYPCARASVGTTHEVRSLEDYRLFQRVHKGQPFRAVRMLSSPLRVRGCPVVVLYYVLVSSFAPLRIFEYCDQRVRLTQKDGTTTHMALVDLKLLLEERVAGRAARLPDAMATAAVLSLKAAQGRVHAGGGRRCEAFEFSFHLSDRLRPLLQGVRADLHAGLQEGDGFAVGLVAATLRAVVAGGPDPAYFRLICDESGGRPFSALVGGVERR